MKKHINVILCLIIYCLIFCCSYVNGLQYTSAVKYAGHTIVGNHTGTLGLFGSDSKEIILDLNVPVSCETENCIVSIPIAITMEAQGQSNSSNAVYSTEQVISMLGITWGGENNSCIFSNGTIDCPQKNNTTLKKVELFVGAPFNTPNGISSSSARLSYNWGGYVSFYSMIDPVAYEIQQQTQQQQAQHNQIMNSNNTTNQNDFITFATNYYIDDKTGTKSFLNVVPNFLNTLNNGTCTPLTLTIPFISRNNQLTIPCMVDFLGEHGFGTLIRIYQFVLSFIVAYWLTVNWFKLFKETIDPFNYRIEVMDL